MKTKNFFICVVLLILVLGPAFTSIIVEGELTHEYEVSSGETLYGTVKIQNIGNEPEEVKVYIQDYLFYSDGRILYEEPGINPRSNANWVSVTPGRFTLDAGAALDVQYSITIPDDTGLIGTYWNILMVETIPPGSAESSTPPDETSLGVNQVFRYGIQLVTHIENTGIRNLQFIGTRLEKGENSKRLIYDVENTGERWLRSTSWTEIFNRQGELVGKFEAGRLRIYPGTSVRFNVDLSSLPPGQYKALVIIDCGNEDIFGGNFNLVLKE